MRYKARTWAAVGVTAISLSSGAFTGAAGAGCAPAPDVARYDQTMRTVTPGSPAHLHVIDERHRALTDAVAPFDTKLATMTPGSPSYLRVVDERACLGGHS